MKEKRDCKIVQDLLPNYIENLTNEETNHFVEEHLKECEECQDILKNMKKELTVDGAKRDNREIKYMKKYNRELKVIKSFLVVILIIILTLITLFVIHTFKKFTILKSLQQKANQYSSITNFHEENTTIDLNKANNTVRIMNVYIKDGKKAYVIETYNKTDSAKISGYVEEGKTITFAEANEKKTAKIINEEIITNENFQSVPFILQTKNDWETFCLSLKIKVETISIEAVAGSKRDYYVLSYVAQNNNSDKYYIDKETGLLYRQIFNDTYITYQYELNNVDDDIFIKPDIKEYELLQ